MLFKRRITGKVIPFELILVTTDIYDACAKKKFHFSDWKKDHKKTNLTLRKIETHFMVGKCIFFKTKIERNKKVNGTSFLTFPGFHMEREGKTIISNIRESKRWKKIRSVIIYEITNFFAFNIVVFNGLFRKI